MPQPTSPPYGPGSILPRTLNRWLDVNAQNGPLTRTRGFISLPLNTGTQIESPPVATVTVQNNNGGNRTYNLYDTNGVLLDSLLCTPGNSITFNNFPTSFSIAYAGGGTITQLATTGWAGYLIEAGDVYTVADTFKVVSDKYLQFNYFSSKRFSLKQDDNLLNLAALYDGKLIVCIAYIDENSPFNKVARYNLTSTSGKEFINAIPYTGQFIKGYFQIEFWNRLDYTLVINLDTPAMILNTTILGDVDYRYGTDFPISAVSAPVLEFTNRGQVINIYNLPVVFNDNNISGLN